MKRYFLILIAPLLFSPCNVLGQNKMLEILPFKDGKVTYVAVVQVDSVSKDELYKRAKHWFIDTFKSAKDVLQLDDKENGELIGRGYLETSWGAQSINIWQSIKIQIKEGRYKYEITDFNVKYYYAGDYAIGNRNIDMSLEAWDQSFKGQHKKRNEIYTDINSKVMSLINSLNKFATTKQKDDW